jgi:protoporphyrin/coproporphyrin ferrochelatase
MSRKAVFLVNLGSPNSPDVPDVRRYLREFLMDGRVIDAPWPIRFGIVNFAILPKRPHASSEAYRSIWTEQGSPLVVMSRRVQAALQCRVGIPVELAMRYQHPSIDDAIKKLVQKNIEELLLIPLFPHYAMSSYETAIERVKDALQKKAPHIRLQVQPPYYDEPNYIAALTESAQPYLHSLHLQNAAATPSADSHYDHLLFSFHGLPERHLKKSDQTGCHCLKVKNCCEVPGPAHATCYRAQCLKTVRAFVAQAGVPASKYSVAFQSRLGRDPWMQPHTDHEIERLARSGVKRLLVICPAFVADCLETLEEIGMRGRESFLHAGGNNLTLIPCLNEHPRWIDALANMVNVYAPDTTSARARATESDVRFSVPPARECAAL